MLRMERKTVPDHEVAMGALADITENDGQKNVLFFTHGDTYMRQETGRGSGLVMNNCSAVTYFPSCIFW